MSITTYSELTQAVADWTHRSDLTSKIPDFIRLAEDIIYGDLEIRSQESITTLTTVASTETITLPTDFIEMDSLSISSTTPLTPLEYLAPNEYQNRYQYNTTGAPLAYTIIGSSLYLHPVPDAV